MDPSTVSGARSAVVPITTTAVLALIWPLPLTWSMVAVAAVALTACVGIGLWHPVTESGWRAVLGNAAAVASCAVTAIGTIALGYAVFALKHVGVFGPVHRLGYPFLVATGLRLAGGGCLLLLCGIVSVIPAFVPETES